MIRLPTRTKRTDALFHDTTLFRTSEVMLPAGAPEKWRDRQRLWNDVEAAELRKDAHLAREIEFAIPREMTEEQGVRLARDFVQREFVTRSEEHTSELQSLMLISYAVFCLKK